MGNHENKADSAWKALFDLVKQQQMSGLIIMLLWLAPMT